MRPRGGIVAALLAAVLAAGCTSERIVLDLEVAASPNPVTGYAFEGGRRWDYTVTITNPNGVGVTVDSYHKAVSGTDSGYTLPLIIPREQENQSDVLDRRIPAGGSISYRTNTLGRGLFAAGTERRIYHTRGDDGRWFSGEVIVELR